MLHRGFRPLVLLRLVLLASLFSTLFPPPSVASALQERRLPEPASTAAPRSLPVERRPPLSFRPFDGVASEARTSLPDFTPTPDPSLQFIANNGQVDGRVRYTVSHNGGTLFFTPSQLVFALPDTVEQPRKPQRVRTRPSAKRLPVTHRFVRQRFLGAAAQPSIRALDPLPGTVNYLLGNDPAQWHTEIATYNGIVYEQLYPGIDLSYHGDDQQLKSVFTIAPRGDPSKIRWRYTGAKDVTIDATGNLIVQVASPTSSATQALTITEQAPIAWQEVNGRRKPVSVVFAIAPSGTVSFQLGAYDSSLPLIIDPTLAYSTYLGGSANEIGFDVVADAEGNAYITGSTTSTDFPLEDSIQQGTGYESAFITKLSADGKTRLFSTYLGGSRDDYGVGIALDEAGNIFAAGTTWSTDFPTENPIQPTGDLDGDAFLVKLGVDGYTLEFSTYLGGSAWDESGGLAVDPAGAAYLTGYTQSTDFPTHNPYQNSLRDSSGDAFVVKANAGDTDWSYSTYLGGSDQDMSWMLPKIAVDANGSAYVTGATYSTDFPTENALKPALNPSWDVDAYVTKLAPAGNALEYSTYFGGSEYDESYAIAVDGDGRAYVTGDFSSTDIGQGCTGSGVFLGILGPSGSPLEKATCFGTYALGYDITVDHQGAIYLAGSSSATNYPLTEPIQPANAGGEDIVVTKVGPGGSGVIFSTYYGGSGNESPRAIAADIAGNAYITGFTWSSNFPTTTSTDRELGGLRDAFVVKMDGPVLPDAQNRALESSPLACSQACSGDPVNTRSGNFYTTVTDLTVPSPGVALAWERSYSSQSTDDLSGALGVGWHHPYATRVITEGAPLGQAGAVLVTTPKGNLLRFVAAGNGQFRADPGVYGTLSATSTTYTLIERDQSRAVFNATTGRLESMRDAQGRSIQLDYDAQGRLSAIRDAAFPTTRYLSLGYSGTSPLIRSVSHGSRTVQYAYDAQGDLTGVTDVMGRPTTYTYSNHLLTAIINALGQQVEESRYETPYTPASKVISQTLQDGRQLQFAYLDATTTVTTTTSDGRQEVEQIAYGANNTTRQRERNGIVTQALLTDGNFSPARLGDGNGNTTTTHFNRAGLLDRVTDSLGATSRISYDSFNRPITITDSLGRLTTRAYDTTNNLVRETTGITTDNPLGFTTLYTYTNAFLTEQQGPDGVVTRWDRNTQGQVLTMTVGLGLTQPQVTAYGYDLFGRLVTSTVGVNTSLARTDVTVYNADDTVAQSIQNYQDGVFDPALPTEDVSTTYGYDDLGRQVWVKDVLEHYTATHYDAAGRVDWTIRNLVPFAVDADGLPISQPFDRTQPDQNVATYYAYDSLGRTTLVTETGILSGSFDVTTLTFGDAISRTTFTEYDALSRPITVTLNFKDGVFDPAHPDEDVQTLTAYDAAGNVTWQRDALGRWIHTEYDALNRPITVTVNYENGDPLSICGDGSANGSDLQRCDGNDDGVADDHRGWATLTDTDLIQVTRYTPDGQVSATIDGYVDGVFNPAEPDRDRIATFHYDALGRPVKTIQNDHDGNPATNPYALAPDRNDTDLVTETAYDAVGRAQGTSNPLGLWVSQHYDALGRVDVTTQNCRLSDALAVDAGKPVAVGCAPFDSAVPDRNVTNTAGYDELGRVFQTHDVVGTRTHSEFDALGRTTATVQNYIPGGSTDSDTNVTTRQAYDALGRTTVITDATGATTRQRYDALGRTVAITDTAARVTRFGYDRTGAQRWVMAPDGSLTVTELDGLGRVVATVQNYQNGTVEAGEPTDQDLITRTAYDAGGRRRATIDAAGRMTGFTYDLRDQLLSVTENVVAGEECPAAQAPCNVTTSYTYDRVGNRLSITDANQHTRTFAYDAMDRQIAATDALGQTTGSRYDRLGRLEFTDDPRGDAYDVTYSYDDLDRPTGMQAQELAAPISIEYNAVGWRTGLSDATGTTSFEHDALGRVTSVSAPQTGTVGYTYTPRGERASLTYPNGSQVSYRYWPDGQLWQVEQGTSVLADYVYDPAGRLEAVTRANGAVTGYAYDAVGRVRSLETQVDGQVVSQFAYQVDRLGLRRVVTETLALDPAAPPTGTPTSTPTTATPTTSPAVTSTPTATASTPTATASTPTATASTPTATASTPTATPDTSTTRVLYDETFSNGWEERWSWGVEHEAAVTEPHYSGSVAYGVEYTSPWGGFRMMPLANSDDWQGYQALRFAIHGGTAGGQQVKVWINTSSEEGFDLGVVTAPAGQWTVVELPLPTSAALAGVTELIWQQHTGETEPALYLDRIELVGGSTPTATPVSSPTATSTATATPVSGDTVTLYDDTFGAGWEERWSWGVEQDAAVAEPHYSGSVAYGVEYTSPWAALRLMPIADSDDWQGYQALRFAIHGGAAGGQDIKVRVNTELEGFDLGVIAPTAGQWTVVELPLPSDPAMAEVLEVIWQQHTGETEPVFYLDKIELVVGQPVSGLSLSAGGESAMLDAPAMALAGTSLQTQSRTIVYNYDGLNRLISAAESGSTANLYTYAYDLVGNRTGVTVNGTTTTTAYNAANQVVGWTYDAAGNLLNDEATTSTYDALGRMTSRGGASYAYNGDSVLVAQTTAGATTRYTQDLIAPLSQVLSDGSSVYLYGHERLAAHAAGTMTWYATDALGSVRQTLDDVGTPIATANYDPWGTPQGSLISPFGFTGELQDAAGLTYLRARWYNSVASTFISARWRVYESNPVVPLSNHVYVYGLNNPVLYTDPQGTCSGPGCGQVGSSIPTATYDWGLVQQHSSAIIDAAKRHERLSDGFSWEVVAALMATTIAREQRWERKLIDAITIPLQGPNGSIGLANTRPGRVVDIYFGNYGRGVRSGENPYNLGQQSLGFLSFFCSIANLDEDTLHWTIAGELSSNASFAIDILGADIERGIDNVKSHALRPSVFNLGLWLWSGAVEPLRLWKGIWSASEYNSTEWNAPGYDNGVAMVEAIELGAQHLGVSMPPYNAYNKTSNARTNESMFVECRPHGIGTQDGQYFVYNENAACGYTETQADYFRRHRIPDPPITSDGAPPKRN